MNFLHKFGFSLKLWLVLALAFLVVLPQTASAKRVFCRSDPVVILSNGVVIDISADVGTLLFNVEEVHYELHGPQGTSPIAVVHTPAWLTSQETFTYYADQPAGQYLATTIVHTSDPGEVDVVARFTLLSALGLRLDYASASGVQGEVIEVSLHS